MQYIDFDYETIDNRNLTIEGQTDGNEVYFKAFELNTEKKVKRNTLSQQDITNIEDYISENCEPEIEHISDFYERGN